MKVYGSPPGTKLEKRLNPDDSSKEKLSKVDDTCRLHDICYRDNSTRKERKKCDEEMIKRLRRIRRNKKSSFSTKGDAYILEKIMSIKNMLNI